MKLPGLSEAEQQYFNNRVEQARLALDRAHAENVSALVLDHAKRGMSNASFHAGAIVGLHRGHIAACEQAKIDALDEVLTASGKPWTRQLANSLLSNISDAMRRGDEEVLKELRQTSARTRVTQEVPHLSRGPNIWLANTSHEFRLDIDTRVSSAELRAGETSRLRKSGYRRLGVVLLAVLACLTSALLLALEYGEGNNWFQRLVSCWSIFPVISVLGATIGWFIIGKDRLRAMGWPFMKLFGSEQ